MNEYSIYIEDGFTCRELHVVTPEKIHIIKLPDGDGFDDIETARELIKLRDRIDEVLEEMKG